MQVHTRFPQKSDSQESFDPGQDSFVQALICRKVNQLIDCHRFSASDRDDLKQEFFARIVKGLERFDPAVGHRYPFVTAVVERYFANILRERNAEKRSSAKTGSLNINIESPDGGPTELIQTVGEAEVDRRLGRERILSEEELNDLRLDMGHVISRLPRHLQNFLELRKTLNLKEISAELGVARATLSDWVSEIRVKFEAAGLERYFQE